MEDLESRLAALEQAHHRNRQRIAANSQLLRAILAMLVFSAIAWGLPIASVKWSGREFEFSRDTDNHVLPIVGGLVAASLFLGDKPIDLLRKILKKG